MAEPMSARAYRANAEKVKAQRPTEVVTLKSGSVFELRRPDLQGYVVTGRVPQSLLSEGIKAWKKQGVIPEGESTLGDEEIANSLIFMREIVHDCCVNPQFVEFVEFDALCKACAWKGQDAQLVVDKNDEPHCPRCGTSDFISQIGASLMMPEDFTEIFAWAMGHEGVAGLAGLQSFRERPARRTAGRKSRSKKLQPETVSTAAN